MDVIAEHIILIWLIPTVPLLLPLLMLFLWALLVELPLVMLRLFRPFYRRILALTFDHYEYRTAPRRKTRNLRAIISDGTNNYKCLVRDISHSGLCIKDIPDAFRSPRTLLSIIVQNGDHQQRLVARPRWQKLQRHRGRTMGVEIAVSPDEWGSFVMSW